MYSTIRGTAPVVALVAMAVALTACSSAAAGPSVASLEDPGGSAAPSQSSVPTDPQEAFLAYAACMRENGVDMPDPEIVEDDGGGETKGFGIQVGGPAGSVDKEKFRAADTECRKHLANVVGAGKGPNLSPEDEEKLLQFARCMREHGIDMPDPQNGGMIINEDEGNGPKIDPNDPDFQAAQEACEALLPGNGAGNDQLNVENEGGKAGAGETSR